VKRHLRRERRQPSARDAAPKPTVAEVVAVAAIVTGSPLVRRRPRAA
jgi:hypothetical protein